MNMNKVTNELKHRSMPLSMGRKVQGIISESMLRRDLRGKSQAAPLWSWSWKRQYCNEHGFEPSTETMSKDLSALNHSDLKSVSV